MCSLTLSQRCTHKPAQAAAKPCRLPYQAGSHDIRRRKEIPRSFSTPPVTRVTCVRQRTGHHQCMPNTSDTSSRHLAAHRPDRLPAGADRPHCPSGAQPPRYVQHLEPTFGKSWMRYWTHCTAAARREHWSSAARANTFAGDGARRRRPQFRPQRPHTRRPRRHHRHAGTVTNHLQ